MRMLENVELSIQYDFSPLRVCLCRALFSLTTRGASQYGVIQSLGDEVSDPILHRMMLSDRLGKVTAGRRLGLYAGEEGVIGRKVSVRRHGKLVGEGIIGWD